MRVIIQRTGPARVEVNQQVIGKIQYGMLVLLGVGIDDEQNDADWLTQKITSLRIFKDSEGKMNQSILESGGSVLVVSQFTLYASTKKGTRPGFTGSADPEKANTLYEYFIDKLRLSGITVESGCFGANMQVHLMNDGPVTIMIDSKNKE